MQLCYEVKSINLLRCYVHVSWGEWGEDCQGEDRPEHCEPVVAPRQEHVADALRVAVPHVAVLRVAVRRCDVLAQQQSRFRSRRPAGERSHRQTTAELKIKQNFSCHIPCSEKEISHHVDALIFPCVVQDGVHRRDDSHINHLAYVLPDKFLSRPQLVSACLP